MNQYEQFQKEQGMQQNQHQEHELDWNDNITQDAQEFVLLPDGDYDFYVESFERSRHNGSEKLPPCNVAVLHLRINTSMAQGGSIMVTHRLNLHSKTEWTLSQFFSSIGQKRKGENLRMDWNRVPGSCGRLKLGHKLYNGNEYNEVKQFYAKEEPKQQAYQPGQF